MLLKSSSNGLFPRKDPLSHSLGTCKDGLDLYDAAVRHTEVAAANSYCICFRACIKS